MFLKSIFLRVHLHICFPNANINRGLHIYKDQYFKKEDQSYTHIKVQDELLSLYGKATVMNGQLCLSVVELDGLWVSWKEMHYVQNEL